SLQRGERLLSHVTSLDGNFADAYALLAQFYSFQAANFVDDVSANLQKAEESAKIAIKINPDSAEGLIALGGIYSEQGREREAIPVLRRAVALAPNHEMAWQMLSYAYYYAGLNDLAELGYRHVIELNPLQLQPHWMHARMLLYSGKIADAEQEMREVV